MEGSVSFSGCRFLDAGLSARSALFSNCRLDCSRVVIDGDSSLNFDDSIFSEAQTNFSEITMPSGLLSLQKTIWYAGFHDFDGMTLCGGRVLFDKAKFEPSQRLADRNRDSLLSFRRCKLEAGCLSFRHARFEYEFDAPSRKRREPPLSDEHHPLWPRTLVFTDSQLTGATVDFSSAQFTRGDVWLTFNAMAGCFLFRGAQFSSGGVSFGPSELHDCLLDFSYARFLGNEESLEFSENVPFCQRWMMPIKESIERGGDVLFSMMRYPVPSVDFAGAVLGKMQIEFECIDAYGGVIDFKGARFDGADVCFAHARFDGLVIVLWNTDYLTRSGQIRLDRYSQPIILTNEHHLTHNKLAIVRTDRFEVGHDGTAEEINNLREITGWAIGISSMD